MQATAARCLIRPMALPIGIVVKSRIMKISLEGIPLETPPTPSNYLLEDVVQFSYHQMPSLLNRCCRSTKLCMTILFSRKPNYSVSRRRKRQTPVSLSPGTIPSLKSDPAAMSHQPSQLVTVRPGSAGLLPKRRFLPHIHPRYEPSRFLQLIYLYRRIRIRRDRRYYFQVMAGEISPFHVV